VEEAECVENGPGAGDGGVGDSRTNAGLPAKKEEGVLDAALH